VLEVEEIEVYYETVQGLRGVTLRAGAGEFIALLGANGAGKSTLLNTIAGLIRPKRGRIRFRGEPIEKLAVERIVSRGISLVPEGRRVFPGLTVLGNLEVATSSWRRHGDGYSTELERVYSLFPALRGKRDQLAWSLSGGEQQMLSIGRGLMTRPRLLMLDEPSLGLAPKLVESLFAAIQQINQDGITLLLVEQNACAALRIAHRGYVLDRGRIIASDEAPELARDERVRKAYLGG
jgi:branched-chain amino acid transport system ATP-binding protein